MKGYPDDGTVTRAQGLEALPLFRRSDPDTSRQAATDNQRRAHRQRVAIVCALDAAHWHGRTADELDQEFDWVTSTAGKRMHELVKDGTVLRTDRRRLTRRGSKASVYVHHRYARAPGGATHDPNPKRKD